MTWLTDDELLIVWRFNFADTDKQRFLEIARAAIAADRDLTAALSEPADGPAAVTDQFRALCAELLDEVVARPLYSDRALIDRARTALSEPAPAPPPEGEVAELVAALREEAAVYVQLKSYREWELKLIRAADLLERQAAPVPVPVSESTDEALAAFTAYFCRNYPGPDTVIYRPEWHAPRLFRAVVDAIRRCGSPASTLPLPEPAPVPVPVDERLPGPEDCDKEGYCWRWNTIAGSWARQPISRRWYAFESHWLPAHALPLPASGREVE